MSDALERLFSSDNNDKEYSLEEQMASAELNSAEENEDFFMDMSDAAKKAFFGGGSTEVTLDDNSNEQQNNVRATPVMETPIAEEPIKEEPIIQPTNRTLSNFMQNSMNNVPQNEPIVVQEPQIEPIVEQEPIIVQENTNTIVEEKPKDVKPKRRISRQSTKETRVESNNFGSQDSDFNAMFIPVMNQLAKDLIDNLRQNNYKIARFNDEQMKILYNYMYTKF